ncbi:MAG: ATP-binding protein [Paludibacteraceae bacterium]|nr:ATP-binding protein [Paludibacteraceae bacterium]MBP6284192.1 ATP-binding protein [Paludibacteraceae bacterium]
MKIAIASGKGGTGKTFVSTNLFHVAYASGYPVTLIDCDAEAPNSSQFIHAETISTSYVYQLIPTIDTDVCTFCGECYDACHFNAIFYLPNRKEIRVMEELCHSCGACSYVCKHGAVKEESKIVGNVKHLLYKNLAPFIECTMNIGIASPVPTIKQAIAECQSTDLVLLDSPPGISCPFIATVETADFVVLVAEPTPFGLNDLRLSIETLQQMTIPFGVVINRDGMGNQEMENWLHEQSIPILLKIPFDIEIAHLYAEGKLVCETSELYRAKFVEMIESIYAYSQQEKPTLCKK